MDSVSQWMKVSSGQNIVVHFSENCWPLLQNVIALVGAFALIDKWGSVWVAWIDKSYFLDFTCCMVQLSALSTIQCYTLNSPLINISMYFNAYCTLKIVMMPLYCIISVRNMYWIVKYKADLWYYLNTYTLSFIWIIFQVTKFMSLWLLNYNAKSCSGVFILLYFEFITYLLTNEVGQIVCSFIIYEKTLKIFFKDWTNNLKLERCKICFKFPWAWIVLACVLQNANMTRVAQIM